MPRHVAGYFVAIGFSELQRSSLTTFDLSTQLDQPP